MDTSEQYIKMRKAAIPHLGNGTIMLSDFRPDSSDNYNVIETGKYIVWIDEKGDWYVYCSDIPPVEGMGSVCQLERQDQLQEMVSKKEPFYQDILDLANFYRDYARWVSSYEQLWLAFLCFEKYNKVWNGSDWVLK